jgi:thiol:disulfide interchange protein
MLSLCALILTAPLVAPTALSNTALSSGAILAPPLRQAQSQEERGTPPPQLYDESAAAEKDIAAALARAKKKNKRVLIQWGANWCGWCIQLDQLFTGQRDVSRKLLYEYEVLHVDIGKFDKHMELAETYGADLKQHGVPFLTVLDGGGKVLANQETGSLEGPEGGEFGHDAARVAEFLTTHQAKYEKAEELLRAALQEAAAREKRVFLVFGAPW